MAEQFIGKLEVGLYCFLDEGLSVILIDGADLREVGVDKLGPVEFVGLKWVLLISQSCASHQIVDHHLMQDDLISSYVLHKLRKDQE